MRWLAVVALVLALASPAESGEPPTSFDAGIVEYFEGRFAEAVVSLKGALREDPASAPPYGPAAVYFLGRSFQELGLRGLALHYLGRAEAAPEWRLPALREIARSYLQIGEPLAVLQVLERVPEGVRDPEVLYVSGIAAAMLGRWSRADGILGEIRPGEAEYPYALYARAQSRAAREDLDGALADLEVMPEAPGLLGPELRDQARILRGKILYLQEREAEARQAFAAVEGTGSAGSEALRGLLLSRADAETAARSRVSEARPADAATLLSLQAVAAEERGDFPLATELRERLRSHVDDQIRRLRDIGPASPSSRILEEDLGRFAARLRRERWRSRWAEERELLGEAVPGDVASKPQSAEGAFRPREGLFFAAWTQARSDVWLRGSIDLVSRSQELAGELEAGPRRGSFWRFWEKDDDRRLATALSVIRLANLEQSWADHLHTLEVIPVETLRQEKRATVEAVIGDLGILYLGNGAEIPEELSNLRIGLDYKEEDMRRLVVAAPERSTDPGISILGNYVDLLEETRTALADRGYDVPSEEAGLADLVREVRRENAELARRIGTRIREVVEPTVRGQLALFTRLAADNDGSLSRLYARAQDGREKP